uniref:Uncharacterized protein n=2 Tax=Lutzomyia longipalpis TaxID=7200 RepID=A0A1B0GL78_LUTLO
MMASTVESSRHQQERQAHDGRPTSAYDNLNGGTKGGGGLKGEGGRKAARSSLGEESIRRSNGGFPYTEISFKFDAIPAASEHQSGVMGRSDDAVTHDECGERNPGAASPPGSQYGGAEKNDKVVNLSEVQQSDEKRRHDHKAIISSAKSNFFGLNGNQSEAEKKDTAEGLTDKGRVPRRRIRLKMDDDEEDSEEYGEETVKLLPEVVNTFNLPATNGYQNVPRNSHKFQHQVSYVQEMKLVESSSSDSAPAKSDVVVPRIKNPARSSTPDNESHRLSQPSQVV